MTDKSWINFNQKLSYCECCFLKLRYPFQNILDYSWISPTAIPYNFLWLVIDFMKGYENIWVWHITFLRFFPFICGMIFSSLRKCFDLFFISVCVKIVAFFSKGKNCVRICIQNLMHIRARVSGSLLAEVAVAVFSFVRDTYHLNPVLFNEFDTNNGYKALKNILKW